MTVGGEIALLEFRMTQIAGVEARRPAERTIPGASRSHFAGYVASAMTETHMGRQPGKISAAAAARLIAAGIDRNRPVIGFPRALYLLSMISPFVPEAISRAATRGIRFHVAPRPET